MSWDFWRIVWPNAAIVFALATVPFLAMALHITSDERPAAIQEVGTSPPVAMPDDLLSPRPQ
jgi:hypothetical protein